MKRTKNLMLIGIALIAGTLMLSSCLFGARETLETICNNKWEAVDNSYTEFVTELSVSSCEDFKSAWEDYVDACVNYQYYNASFENAFDDLDCSIYAK